MIMGVTFSIEPHHIEDLISISTHALAHITVAIVEIISLIFGTITWFPSFVAHGS
jgi:hypothetical protein